MLQVNQLTGFGVGGSGYPPGTVSAAYITGGTSITSSTSLVSSSFTGTSGRLLVPVCAADNNGTAGAHSFAGMALATGGSGQATLLEDAYDPGAAAAGAGLAVYSVLQTAGGSNTATINFSPATLAKALSVFQAYHSGGAPVSATVSTPSGGTGTAPNVTVSALAGDVLVGVMAVEARTSTTADAAWGSLLNAFADTGTAGTSMVLTHQIRAISADGSYTWAPTFGASRDYMAAIITFRASP